MEYKHKLERTKNPTGTLLTPPGHADYEWTIRQYNKFGVPTVQTEWNLHDATLPGSDCPEHMQRAARRKMAEYTPVASELWQRDVYGFYHDMYLPEDMEWRGHSQDLVSSGRTGEEFPPERHGAVFKIREYFPDHEPRLDLIDPDRKLRLFGSHACVHCGKRVQYEARVDALVVYDGMVSFCENHPHGHAWEK